MRPLTPTLIWLPGVILAWSVASAVEPAADAQAAPPEPPAAPPPAELSRPDPLRDYIEQARAQRRAQIERLRAESRDESERARQQHRESVQEESRLHREQLERWWEPKPPDGPPPPGDWSNPWYYRGW